MKHKNLIAVIGTVLIFAIFIPIGIQLGKWGEPRSEWLYCEILKLCQ